MAIQLTGSLEILGNIIASAGITGSFSGSATSASFASTLQGLGSASFAPAGTFNIVSQSFATTSGSIAGRVTLIEGQYATTGSNNFTSPQQISDVSNAISFTSTASLYTDGGLRVKGSSFISGTAYFNDVVVYGTSSIEYITSSQLAIGTNIITLNTDTPSVRFGGISVFDSGSNNLSTGSLFWDSEKDKWIYSNPSASTYDGGMLISGPRNTSGLGNEVGTTSCALMMGQGGDHITSSAIFHYGNATCIPNTLVGSTICSTMVNASCIGVGTTTPSCTLDVNGTLKSNYAYLGNTGAGSWVLYATNNDQGNARIRMNNSGAGGQTFDLVSGLNGVSNAGWSIYDATNAATRLYVTNCGCIGIGNGSPISLLDVRSGFITTGTATSTGGSILMQGYYSNGALTTFGTMYSSGGPVIGYGVTPSTSADTCFLSSTGIALSRGAYYMQGGSHIWYSGGTQTCSIGTAVSMTELMRITSGGNGTFLGSVTANGVVVLGSNSSSTPFCLGTSTARFQLMNGGVYGLAGDVLTNGSTYLQSQRTDGNTSTYNLLLQPLGGNVGIGTSTPGYPLEICYTGGYGLKIGTNNATSANNAAIFFSNDASATAASRRSYMLLDPNGGNGSGGDYAYLDMFGSGNATLMNQLSTGNLILGTAGTTRVFVCSNGYVGIGTDSPFGPLVVYKSNSGGLGGHIILNNNGAAVANETAVMFGDGGIDTIRAAISSTTEGSPYYGSLKFKTGLGTYDCLTTQMTITGAGNVGIGFSTVTNKLQVAGEITTHAGTNTSYYSYMNYLGTTWNFGSGEVSDAVNFRICGASASTAGNAFGFWTQPGNTTPVLRLKIDKNGSVGIGTSCPKHNFDINSVLTNAGGFAFCNMVTAQGTWSTFACVGSDANVVTTITYTNTNDHNRSGVFIARWSYNDTCASLFIRSCLWNDSQNIVTLAFRNFQSGALQICVSGGGGDYRVQAFTQGTKAT